jgi:putative GTP pyrophosphokinase
MTLHGDWERYRAALPRYKAAAEDVRVELQRIAKISHIPADVSARAKDPGEFVRKALRKPYDRPWEQTDDKAGARAVVEREQQVDDLLAAVMQDPALRIVESTVDDKRTRPPERLEYGGVHLQVVAPSHPDDADDYQVEVQLRTKAQDLWSSVVSHRLLYKKAIELPEPVQRRLVRLLVLMEMFDQEVTQVVKELPSLRGFSQEKLSTAAETAYLGIHPVAAWDKTLSGMVVDAVAESLQAADLDGYVEDLATFVSDHSRDLAALLTDYASEAAEGNPDYVLFQQPELVLLWERLEHAPDQLMAAWRKSRLPYELLERTANVLGLPLEDD